MSKELDKLFPLESFIHGSYIDPKICDALVKEHKNSKDKKPGVLKNNVVDVLQKDSVDLICGAFPKGPPFTNYFDALQIVLNEYQKKYKEVGLLEPFHVRQNWKIQYYRAGGGYKVWHHERNGPGKISHRCLVFMTYLNDVPDGGTEFKYQKIIAPAKKGLTLIWPTDFTHTHKGQRTRKHEKYIATGWFHYRWTDEYIANEFFSR